jgi:hypothetical protein
LKTNKRAINIGLGLALLLAVLFEFFDGWMTIFRGLNLPLVFYAALALIFRKPLEEG